MNELESLTASILEKIGEKITNKTVFNLWFGDFKLLSLEGETAKFQTPSELRKNIILTKYKDILEKAIFDTLGFNPTLDITYRDSNSRKNFDEIIDDHEDPDFERDSKERERKIRELLNSSDIPKNKNLLAEYTFENFIEGASNKFAKAACFAVANDPTCYNPLFIYGHSGLGKTHLLYAVINYIREHSPRLKIVYQKSEDFMNELIEAISHARTREFKDKYRSCDILLLDDIQFIAGKESTQEEFFHTFSALYESGKQIILTSDRPPKEISPLEDRLRTRFEGGLIADVQPPSFELRTAIIRKKAGAMNLIISNEMVDYMAERLQNNIRQIEGAIKRLGALYNLSNSEVSKESIDQVISVIDPGNIPTDVLIEKIITVVAKNYGVTTDQIKSKKKTDTIANARHIAIYIIRKMTSLSLKEIGEVFGRDYTTVLASINKVEINIKTMNNVGSLIKKLIKEVKG